MTIWDDRILEILRDTDSGTPSELAGEEYIKVSRQQVSRRLQKLKDHGLVKHFGNGVYVITERGEKYLDGEISTYEDEPDEIPETDDRTDSDVSSPSSPG